MAFDSQTRNKLQRMVGACRRLLADEFDDQLQGLYGIYAQDGRVLELEKLTSLGDDQHQTATLLRDRINHLTSGMASEKQPLAEAVRRVLREQAFTVLNRFAALRMAEERGFTQECVGQGLKSKGFQVFETVARSGLGGAYERYVTFIHGMFDELSLDLGVLFDRWSPFGLLFPREPALLKFFELLNDPELKPLWREDETVGWIYQYFNDEAERKKMREESAAPRNSRELAVRNQFFTPRYVVEFLTDNTLGRIWYEMTQGNTKLKEQCHYLVRRPNEIFLKAGDKAPEQPKQDNLSQDDLLKQPVHIPHRPVKDPRTILMLDPACGSMHFGLYAFDLFEVIYEEAWELEKRGAEFQSRPPGMLSLQETYGTKEDFLKDVPRLIIEHNLHGIDIDPRCAQIAGLSLWLRAQKAWQRLGLKPAERPVIKRSNIVCAEPMPGEKELLREFVEREFPAEERGVCLRLLETIFEKMQLAGEAGSLLKIEEEIRNAIEEARRQWQTARQRPEFFDADQLATLDKRAGAQQELPAAERAAIETDFRSLTSEDFWERIEQRIYDALRDYAEQAENGGGFQRRLFAEDAARGFAFIDVCRKRYDVALMNPPFGLPAKDSKQFLTHEYPETWKDIYAAFCERLRAVLHRGGLLGAITPSMWQYSRQLRDFRKSLLECGSPNLLVELGGGVMDEAAVEASVWTANTMPTKAQLLSLDLLGVDREDRASRMRSPVSEWRLSSADQFTRIAESPYCHHLAPELLALWTRQGRLCDWASIAKGNTTFDDFRFLRLLTELPLSERGRWRVYRSGGDFQPFFAASLLAIDWANDGAAVRRWGTQKHGSDAQVMQSSELWFLAGLGYPRVGTLGFGVRLAQPDEVFSGSSVFILPAAADDRWLLLAILNSSPALALFEGHGRHRRTETIALKDLPVRREDFKHVRHSLESLAKEAVQAIQEWEAHDESNPIFGHVCWRGSFGSHGTRADAIYRTVLRCACEATVKIRDVLGVASLSMSEPDCVSWKPRLSKEDEAGNLIGYALGCAIGRWDIRYATGEQATPELPDPFAPLPICPPGQLQSATGLPIGKSEVQSLKSKGEWNYSIEIPWDGILVDDPNHPLDIERCVREVIEIIWKDRAEAIEHEACELLGVKSLRDYFRKPAGFFADHLKRYSKSRRQAPIYWPLSTASGSYTLWIYYHRLTDQTLFQCVNDFVKPKLEEVNRDIERLRGELQRADGGNIKQREKLEELEDFTNELKEFHDELLRVAGLPYKPNLNDGVLINASPLWKLFRLPKWQKDLKACWAELEGEEYEWAHMAYTIWPDRVKKVCKTDRSIAIAHGLEELCDVKAPEKKAKRGKKSAEQIEMGDIE